jgi:GNAT superfamily N-acetyltransferase
MITAQVEQYSDALPELAPLYLDHWSELALDKEYQEAGLDPMWDIYEQRNADGQVLLVTLRDTGRMIGYFLGFVAPGLHYRKCLTYHSDIFRIVPEYRGRMGGKRMVRAVIAECKRRGVKRMFLGEKLHMPCAELFAAFGARPVERTHSLWLS